MIEVKKMSRNLLIALFIALAISGAPVQAPAATDPCIATLSPDLLLTLPSVTIDGVFYSVVLQVVGASGDLVETDLVDFQPTTLNCMMPAAVTTDTSIMLHIPSLIFGTDDYGINLEYDPAVTAARMAATGKRTRLNWRLVKVFANKDVWKGASTCTYTSTWTPATGGTETDKTVTTGAATFVRGSGFGGELSGILPFGPEYWQLLSGYISYSMEKTSNLYPACPSTTTAGPINFPMKNTMADGLFFDMVQDSLDVFHYTGGGLQVLPNHKEHIRTNCPVGPPVPDEYSNKGGDYTTWLGFPPNSRALLADRRIAGTGEVMRQSSPEVTSTITCNWNFTYLP